VMAAVTAKKGMLDPVDLLSAEAMGTDIPRRWASCQNCKVCRFQATSLSFREDKEYSIILDGLKFDEKKKRWTASYPFCESSIILADNYKQVKGFTEGLERKLEKKGRVDEVNKQFYETVERVVFHQLTDEEIEDWDGPVNYISMVEALKNRHHATSVEDMHEQQSQATPSSEQVAQQYIDEGTLLVGGPVHCHTEH